VTGRQHTLHWWRLRLQWYRKRLVLTQPPYFINLEPTGFCNLRCAVCSYQQNRGKGYLEPGLALRTIDEAADYGVSEIRFFLAGEPLFHPHLGELIAAARERGLLTQVHTNATILDARRAEMLLDSGLDTLSLSFDGETASEYEAIRCGGEFQRTLDYILDFLHRKKERGSRRPYVTLQVIKPFRPGSPPTPVLSEEFRQRFTDLPVDRFLALYPFTWPGQEKQEYARPVGRKFFPCPVLWQSLSVAWDGRVLGCCGDLNGVITLGHVGENRLEDIWNGPAMQEMRRLHIQEKHHTIPLCRDCDVTSVRVHPAIRDLKELVFGQWTPI